MQQSEQPHADKKRLSLVCAVITVSDTRSIENDYSGSYLADGLYQAGHKILCRRIIPDEADRIDAILEELTQDELHVLFFNGGTGIAPRDTTYDALVGKLEKTITGFGELFRYLSYQEIGSRAMASRAIAGTYKDKLIFSLPGSTSAVKLAMEKLIEPELIHLVSQLRGY